MSSFLRPVVCLLSFAIFSSPGAAQSPAPAPSAEPSASSAESKLAVALRSYSLLDAEADRLRAANAQLIAEKSTLEAKLTEVQAAVPLATQAGALREQLRQTQAQMAAYAEENLQLRTKLSLSASNVGSGSSALVAPSVSPAPAVTPAGSTSGASTRSHVITAGDTLVKISQKYYSTPNRWSDILAANREALRDEKSLIIGRTIVIP